MADDPKQPTVEDDVAIRVEGVSKSYPLWSSPHVRLKHALMSGARRLTPSDWEIAKRLDASRGRLYREFKALEQVSLEIKKGESWGVIGVNGSGKSTLLKIISGNLRPSTGRVEVEGKVGKLDYTSGLNGNFTGRENIYIKAAMMGMPRRDIDERYDSIVDFAGIGDFINQPVKTYSSGMQARLGFAIIAHMDRDILISDEALAVGDAFFVQKCMEYIRKFLKTGTFLFVTHSTNDVINLCQKAVWLEHGRIKEIGPAKAVAQAYASSQSLTRSKRYLEESKETGADTASQVKGPEPDKSPSSDVRVLVQPKLSSLMNSKAPRVIRDARLEWLNKTQWRNDIEIPSATIGEGMGVGGARVTEVTLEDHDGAALSWVIGAELVRLNIVAFAERDIAQALMGFQVFDRLGQVLFADNTHLTTIEKPLSVKRGESCRAQFEFQMPLLPIGEYVVRASMFDGIETKGAMLHAVPALTFRVRTSGARHGLVGVPMSAVRIERIASERAA